MSYGADIFVNPKYVNYNNSQWSANFTSNAIPCGLPEPINNVAAASSMIKGVTYGGNKKIKKIKNINNIYMKNNLLKNVINSYFLTKKKFNKIYKSSGHKKTKLHKKLKGYKKSKKNKTRKSHTKKMRGGYSQYMNNQPNTPVYGLGGVHNNQYPSALANPPPYNILSKCTNCVDNYNHNTNIGFPSKGSY